MQPGSQPARCSFESCFNMKYENNEYRLRYARALKAARNFVTLASYRVVDEWLLLPPALREGLNVPAEGLMLLPSGGEYPYRLIQAVRETRINLLIVEPGKTIEGAPTIYFTLLRCEKGELHRHPMLRLWTGPEQNLFLIPAPGLSEPEDACFQIWRGVRPSDQPWANQAARDLGLHQGDAVLLAP